MRNTTKRVLSFIMVIALMMTLAPLSVFAAESGTTVYLKPNSNWIKDGTWFAAYYWNGSSNNWTKLTDADGDGLYEGVIPAGNTNIIFCRMNPAKTALSWDSKWDQTKDLKLDGTNNCFTVGDGQWNNATGTWSVYTPADIPSEPSNPSSEPSSEPDTQPTSKPITGLVGDYYLFGYINGANYGCEEDAANAGIYKFVNGTVSATFTKDSYVAVKTGDNSAWYMTDGWQGTTATSVTLYNTVDLDTTADKLYVPAGVEVTFTLVDNGDDTFTLSYTTGNTPVDPDPTPDPDPDPDPDPNPDVGGIIPSGTYYLFGYINGADYGEGTTSSTLGQYKFVNGTLTATFPSDSYVGIKNAAMSEWYMTKGWLGAKTSATLYDTGKTSFSGTWDKMMVPGGVELTFYLRQNTDGSMQLSYVRNEDKGVQDTSGVQAGVTLHCWNWSYNNIAANMEAIAAAGYTAVQTSPAQAMKEATDKAYVDFWWVFYQPVDFKMNTSTDNALGTKAEFEAMCKVADEYGVKVIVDVVANHLGNQTGNDLSSAIPEYLLKDAYWHDYSKNISQTDYDNGDRYAITHKCMGGLPDLNTSNKELQGYVLDYLKECIDAGADGFRFDAAKHIESPYDDDGTASDFWPTVIGGAEAYAKQKGFDLYCYGELLDEPGKKVSIVEYTEFMAVTDNSWGNCLRAEINKNTANVNLQGYYKAAPANQLVLWAESHDTYGNDGKESTNISVANINKTWALVAARGDAMGLYFARPESYAKPATSTTTKLGDGGANTGWANPEVVAVNKFHHAFNGQPEKIGNAGGIAYVVRGNSGVVLVNYQGTSKSVSGLDVGMADGTYTDQVTGTTFTVSGGKISGSIGSTGIAVVYNDTHTHSYEKTVTEPTCTAGGYTTYTCSCGDSYVADETTSLGHNYVDGACTRCGATDPVYAEYSLVGWINGADHGDATDWENPGDYIFVDGKLTVTFEIDSYVFVKTTDNTHWYLFEKYCTDTTGTLVEGAPQKMFVPGGVEITFTLVVNADGTLTLSYVAAEKPVAPKFDITLANLTLGNDLTLYFYIPADGCADWTGTYAVITKPYANGTETATVTVPFESWESGFKSGGKDLYRVAFNGIAAKEMTDEVTIEIFNAEGKAISNPGKESVRSYLDRFMEKNAADAVKMRLAIDMLNYGAAAQTHFGYNTDNLANAGLSDEQKAFGTATAPACVNGNVKGANVKGSNLTLESSILMNFYFNGLTEDMYAVVTFTDHTGASHNEKLGAHDGSRFTVNQVVVADARQLVTVTVYNADGSVYGTCTDSVESYVARARDAQANGLALYEAIIKFADSAYVYLHNR